jgi:hypothetical protein
VGGHLAGEAVREESGLITIGEFIAWKQPKVWERLLRRYLCFTVNWRAIMEEPPKPGRAGLLPEEVEAIG